MLKKSEPSWFLWLFATLLSLLWIGQAAASETLRSRTGGDVHALIVGIDDYLNVQKLEGSVGDARDFAAVLGEASVSDVRLLLDRQVTRAALLREIRQLLDRSRAGDLAIITYSGHGAAVPEYPQFQGLEPGGTTEEFIMADYGLEGPATGEVVANKEIKALLSRFDSKGVDVLFIADSCFGGGMVRGLPDARVGIPPLRFLRNTELAPSGNLSAIPMTEEELRVDVRNLSHVTFLSGSDRFTPVPEVFIPAPPSRRGALSFVLARALSGKATKLSVHELSRRDLFAYAYQEVQHFSDDQRIETSPKSDAPAASLDRAVFQWKADQEGATKTTKVQNEETRPAKECGVIRISVVNAVSEPTTAMFSTQVLLSTDPTKSDLVWDIRARQVVQDSGDVVANSVGTKEIADVIRRTSALKCVKQIMEDRPQTFRLRYGSKQYSPRDTPIIDAEDVAGRYLIVFNLAGNGAIQLLYPVSAENGPLVGAHWSSRPPVVEPFGSDYVVAVTSTRRPANLLDWLIAKDGTRVDEIGSDLVSRLRELRAQDVTVRIGAVTLYTVPN